MQEWLEKHKDKIKVFYLPPYAPEYNPDELVNSDLKRSVGSKASAQSKEELDCFSFFFYFCYIFCANFICFWHFFHPFLVYHILSYLSIV